MRLRESELDRLLDEDAGFGDLTTRLLDIGGKPGRMTFTARGELILCGSDEASQLLTSLGASVTFAAATGVRCSRGALLLAAEGSAAGLHAGWKTAQTLMEWASGIATAANEIVLAARAYAPHIQVHCTRKAIPFTRQLSQKAVIAGGGEIHRLGLFDTIMLFEEHRAFLERPADLKAIIGKMRERLPGRTIAIEVITEVEAFCAAGAMADVIHTISTSE